MTTTGEIAAERAQLGSRDRDELHEIASAMGVRGATRLRKADLIEAILDKATSGASVPEPTGEKPKKRAARKKAGDPAESAASTEAAPEAPAPAAAGANGRPEAPAREPEAPPAAGSGPSAAGSGPSAEASPAESQRFSFDAPSESRPSSGAAPEAGDGQPAGGPSSGQA